VQVMVGPDASRDPWQCPPPDPIEREELEFAADKHELHCYGEGWKHRISRRMAG
jgi:hypothetical protein